MDYPFATEGCSGGMSWLWQRITGRPVPWEGLCVDHDRRYWAGGTRAERADADAMLYRGMVASGHRCLGIIMWLAVRVGGHPLLPTSWRWGYGWRYPHGYDENG